MNNQFHIGSPAAGASPFKHGAPARAWLKRCGTVLGMVVMLALPARSITLASNPSPDSTTVGYNVQTGGASGVYTNKVSVGNKTSAIFSNLVAGKTYYFAVTSYNSAGIESLPSNEAVYTVPTTTTGSPVVLGSPALSAGHFSFSVPGTTGDKYAVEASVDLVNWVRVATNTAPFTFVDNKATNYSKRFYRTVNLANLAAQVAATAPPVTLASPALANSQFSFMIPGVSGAKYAVEASVDLINWSRVATNTAPFTFTDTNASHYAKRFYRTVTVQ